jgi:pimeloyl-ACP methyl ester carboxylesterase
MNKKNIKISNGETIYYLEEGNLNNNVLVLIHGNQSSSIHHLPLIERLKDKYHLIVPDLRGFGDSTYLNKINSIEDFSNDMIDFLSIIGIKKYSLLGWSTGGGIALRMASINPEQVEKLVLVESCSYRGYPIFKKDANGAPIIGEFYHSIEELASDPIQVAPLKMFFDTQNKAVLSSIWDQAIYSVNKPTPEMNEIYMTETMKQRNIVEVLWSLTTFNMSQLSNGVTLGDGSISKVTCPVLSIWGKNDLVVLEYMIDETCEALGNCKKLVFNDSGHSPYVDKPDQLALEIDKFLNE